MKDSELKNNTVYWVEIIDPKLKDYFGKQLMMRFTGIVFRTLKYDPDKIVKAMIDPNKRMRHNLMNTNLSKQIDSTLFLNQVKVFREAKHEEIIK